MAKKEETIKENRSIIETGVVALDLVLGGGLPRGKVIELNGESGCGKTTLALYVASKLCKLGYKVRYIDIERGVTEGILNNMKMLDYLGTNFILDQTTSLFSEFQAVVDECVGKDPKDRLKKPVRHENTPDLIILDSLAMLVPDASKEKDIESNVSNNMLAARYTTQIFKDITGDLAETGVSLLFINHTQTKMKKFGFSGQIAYQDSAGSSMVKYGTDIRLYIDGVSEIKGVRKTLFGNVESRIGSTAYIWTKKSRLEDNGIRVPIELIDAFGVFNGYTLKTICEKTGWIAGAGGHYYVKEPLVKPEEMNNEKGFYLAGSRNVEIFCQDNAGKIIDALKRADLWHLTLDRAEHSSMIDVVKKVDVVKK